MDEGEREQTLSISLVDGITCGLASALLLLIVFGINMGTLTASLGGSSGMGTTSAKAGDLLTEPVDMVVEVDGPVDPIILDGTRWGSRPHADDRAVDPSNGGRIVFIREIPDGFSKHQIKGGQAPTDDVSFTLAWKVGNAPPHGTIHIFRSGSDAKFTFHCKRSQARYRLIEGFDLVHAKLRSECAA